MHWANCAKSGGYWIMTMDNGDASWIFKGTLCVWCFNVVALLRSQYYNLWLLLSKAAIRCLLLTAPGSARHSGIHLKTHSGEKSNKCNRCDYASSQAGDLKRHLKSTVEKRETNAATLQGRYLLLVTCSSWRCYRLLPDNSQAHVQGNGIIATIYLRGT